MIYDTVVVGAGPAGALLAYDLARRGLEVLLIEKARLPRYKACGGGLTLKTIQSLPFDVSPALEQEADGGIVCYGGQPLLRTPLRRYAWLAMRDRFDHFLVQQAVAAGAYLADGLPVIAVEEGRDHVVVRTRDGDFAARFVAGADGVNSVVARAAGLLSDREVGVAIEAELAVPDRALEAQGAYATFDFGALPGGYGWIFPKRDHLSVGVFRAQPGQSRGLKHCLEAFIASHAVLHESRRLSLQGHFIPLGGKKEPLHKGRALLLGDAANLADPWLGEGVYYAVVSARIAAEVVWQVLSGAAADLSAYTARIHSQIIRQLGHARRFASLVYRFPRLGSQLLSRSPLMQSAVFGVIRGDITFRQLNRMLTFHLPRILLQAVSFNPPPADTSLS